MVYDFKEGIERKCETQMEIFSFETFLKTFNGMAFFCSYFMKSQHFIFLYRIKLMVYVYYLNLFIMHAVQHKVFENDLTKEFGPVGNRHDLDHFACSFHAIHPYLIYVIERIETGDQGRFSYEGSDKSRLDSVLIQEMDQIELKGNSIIKITCLCALKVYVI